MPELDESRAPQRAELRMLHAQLLRWLLDDALPLWDRHGVDRAAGGYFEDLTFPADGAVVSAGAVRRGRVVARQIYAFDVGRRLGWRAAASSPLDHGCEYLFSRLHAGEGVFHTAVTASTHAPLAAFSLYETAFYLFALARLRAAGEERFPIESTALRCLQWLRGNHGRRVGGFEESNPPSEPLKSNPHMHLLEAALAWLDATDAAAGTPWIALAQELVGLCLTRFRDASTGAIREYFDFQWRPAAGDDGRVVEPGHQFEWAWLLLQWARSPHCAAPQRAQCMEAAGELVDLGERWGVDPVRGVAINELWDDMTPKDAAAKLWPQTERVKAWCAMLDIANSPQASARAARHAALAVRGMQKYFRPEPAGTWYEVLEEGGGFMAGPTKASSFYHVVCAIDVLGKSSPQ